MVQKSLSLVVHLLFQVLLTGEDVAVYMFPSAPLYTVSYVRIEQAFFSVWRLMLDTNTRLASTQSAPRRDSSQSRNVTL